METPVDYDQLDDALRRCGAGWDASQAHGLLAGRLATAGADAGFEWLSQVLEGTDANNALRNECEGLLRTLFEATYRQLAERQSEFEPLLPDDEDATSVRASALAHWCEGFLHGLVSAEHGDALKQRLAAEPLADIIRDMLEITRAAADDDTDCESEEIAYTELVEYLRVAAQLTYEELAELRAPAEGGDEGGETPEVLH
jgi:yecA family protein